MNDIIYFYVIRIILIYFDAQGKKKPTIREIIDTESKFPLVEIIVEKRAKIDNIFLKEIKITFKRFIFEK